MNRESPYLIPLIINNLARIGSPKDMGLMRQASTVYNKLMSSVYFDKLNRTLCFGGDNGAVYTHVEQVDNFGLWPEEKRLPPCNEWPPELVKMFRKIEIEQYCFDYCILRKQILDSLPTLLNPFVREIKFRYFGDYSGDLYRFPTDVKSIINFINNFHEAATIKFDDINLNYLEKLKTIIQNVEFSRQIFVRHEIYMDKKYLQETQEIVSKFNVFPNVTFDVGINEDSIRSYEEFIPVFEFCLKNIDNCEFSFKFDLSAKTFPGTAEESFKNTICQLSEKVVNLSYNLKENANVKYRSTLDSIKFPKLEFLCLTNYPNVSNVLSNCPNLKNYLLDVDQSSCIFIANEKSDGQNLANYLGVDRGNLVYLTTFTYFYSEGDKLSPGSEVEIYLKSLLPSEVEFESMLR